MKVKDLNTYIPKPSLGKYLRFKYFGIFGILAFFLFGCAQKLPPLAKDRLKPKLVKVTSINNRQVLFTFSEELDTISLKPEDFKITSAGETLTVLTVYPSLSAAEVMAVTKEQIQQSYEVAGFVCDKEGNRGAFKTKFSGAAKRDTIAPWLKRYTKGSNNKEFLLVFSEAMDTTSLKFTIVPKKGFVPSWQNYRTLIFTPLDSLSFDSTYYLYLKEVSDLSGNFIRQFITHITPDTVYRPLFLRAKVMIADTLTKTGIAIIKREYPLGISLVLEGEVMFEVRDSLNYNIEVIANGHFGTAEASVAKENIIILKPGEWDLDTLLN